ncbi:MAG TPA: LysM peptidoglycan-binding domain-containing protein, partial [Anaerolineaceae bacterium]
MAAPNSEHGSRHSSWDRWLPGIGWGGVVVMLAVLAAVLIWHPGLEHAGTAQAVSLAASGASEKAPLADFSPEQSVQALVRFANVHTDIPERASLDIQKYTVQTGDSVFGIAKTNNIKPETILYANYAVLNDSPDALSVGQVLNIPPVDGVYYQWQAGDTLKGVADQFHAQAEDILTWPGNHLDVSNPDSVTPGTWIMIPGGTRPFRSWVVPIVARGKSG